MILNSFSVGFLVINIFNKLLIKGYMKSICVGSGLIALDIILNGNPNIPPKYQAGG